MTDNYNFRDVDLSEVAAILAAKHGRPVDLK